MWSSGVDASCMTTNRRNSVNCFFALPAKCHFTKTGSTTITYSYLNPDTYRINAFCDENNNGVWDTGKYLTKQQPEKVFAFPKSISIRAYWDLEETFKIGSNN